MDRLHELAPEEIAGTVLLVLVILFVGLRPAGVTRVFDSPWSTPAPGGGPAGAFLAGHGALLPAMAPTASPDPTP